MRSKRRPPLIECVIVSETEYLWTFADWMSVQSAKVKTYLTVDKYPEAVALFVKDTTTGFVWYMTKDKKDDAWSTWKQRKMHRVYQSWLDYASRVTKDDAYQEALLKRRSGVGR